MPGNFFLLNRQIILFVYGLTFFVLGLAIAFQSRQHSRLDLARSLPWLAAFGFSHGLFEWGDLFIPIQATYLAETGVLVLNSIQSFLLALSFACLFQFGILLLRPTGRARLFRIAPVASMLLWFAGALLLIIIQQPEPNTLWREVNALARYGIGFPGALLAAYGLRYQALHRISPLNVPHVTRMLRVAGYALAAYALFAGLVVSAIPFFPGNVINSQAFSSLIGIPPSVFRSIIGLTLAIAMIRALDIFDLETERFIEHMEQQQILSAERDRLARDLHDTALQKVYAAGLLLESAQRLTLTNESIRVRLERAAAVLNDAIGDMRRNLGELSSTQPLNQSLEESLRKLAFDLRFQAMVDISLELDLPKQSWLSGAQLDQILAIVNESLSNVVRHAQARHVCIQARHNSRRVELDVQDDGIGLPHPLEMGYGLRNMRDRAHLLGGEIEIRDMPGKGTQVHLDIPWKEQP